MGPRDTTGVGVGVPLLLVEAVPANLSLLAREKFGQELRQAQGLAIVLAG